jgi:hypothetical protein
MKTVLPALNGHSRAYSQLQNALRWTNRTLSATFWSNGNV